MEAALPEVSGTARSDITFYPYRQVLSSSRIYCIIAHPHSGLAISRSSSVSLEKNAAHPVDKTQNRVQPRPAQGAVRQPWTMQRIPAANGRSRIICDSRRQYLVQKPLPLLSDDRIRESVFNEALAIPIERVVSGSANSELTRATYSRPNFGSLATRASVFFQSSKCRI